MQDRQEKAQGRESEAKGQAVTSHQAAGGECSSSIELPPGLLAMLPKLPDGDGILTKPSNPAPEASCQGKKHPLNADNEVIELLDHDEVARPPKKKKKKNKSKDRSKDETPSPEAQDDGACANSMAEPEVAAEEPVLVSTTSGTLAEGTKVPKKKKKKSAELERF